MLVVVVVVVVVAAAAGGGVVVVIIVAVVVGGGSSGFSNSSHSSSFVEVLRVIAFDTSNKRSAVARRSIPCLVLCMSIFVFAFSLSSYTQACRETCCLKCLGYCGRGMGRGKQKQSLCAKIFFIQ